MYTNVKTEMSKHNVTLKDIAEKLDCTVSTLSLKINGKAPITFEEARTIKQVLHTNKPLEELFEVQDDD